jgi:hypothetical protein
MNELFEIGDRFDSPLGVVIAGVSAVLDELPHEALHSLLKRIKVITIVSEASRLDDLPVFDYRVTTSLADKRNIFLLLGKGVDLDMIPLNGRVLFDA